MVATLPTRLAHAACILAQNAPPGTPAWDTVLASTSERLAAGDDIVMWSEAGLKTSTSERLAAGDDMVMWIEAGLKVFGREGEQSLLSGIGKQLAKHPDAFVGATYSLHVNATGGTAPECHPNDIDLPSCA
ncbi:hypothetical protein T484DRAFT_1782994, partial [Baffinella frigidus]